eukprot:19119_1
MDEYTKICRNIQMYNANQQILGQMRLRTLQPATKGYKVVSVYFVAWKYIIALATIASLSYPLLAIAFDFIVLTTEVGDAKVISFFGIGFSCIGILFLVYILCKSECFSDYEEWWMIRCDLLSAIIIDSPLVVICVIILGSAPIMTQHNSIIFVLNIVALLLNVIAWGMKIYHAIKCMTHLAQEAKKAASLSVEDKLRLVLGKTSLYDGPDIWTIRAFKLLSVTYPAGCIWAAIKFL